MSADGPNRRWPVVALIALALLVLAGLWISGALRQSGAVQHCIMQGRTNC